MEHKSPEGFAITEASDVAFGGHPWRPLSAPRVAHGLYDPAYEHDACGMGFVAHIRNKKSHDIICDGLKIICNMEHRGAVGADPKAGDGVGILMQLPDRFLRKETADICNLPTQGDYGVGMVFMPRDADARAQCEALIVDKIHARGAEVLGWRTVPTEQTHLSKHVAAYAPVIRQVIIGRGQIEGDTTNFERNLFVIRRHIEHAVPDGLDLYIASFSAQVITYKGLVLADAFAMFYPDLLDPTIESAFAMAHQRFSTNTFPSWELAHPYRMICHNGEINTLRGNVNWMAARHETMSSKILGDDLEGLWPLIPEGQSDSACFDNALELLVMSGYSLAHAMMMLIPEAWNNNPMMDPNRRAFYEYNAALMEPWDGPAAVAFTNGHQIGATLDRNGLRPARYYITRDDRVVLASEAGVLAIAEESIVTKWRLQPGKMLLIDLEQGRIIDDTEIKETLAQAYPWREWLEQTQIKLENLPLPVTSNQNNKKINKTSRLNQRQAFGYTQEDIKFLLEPMLDGNEATGSMGNDTPLAPLSDKSKLIYTYFKQTFAQVTNPPIDPIRENLVMSLVSFIGPRPNLLDFEDSIQRKRLEVTQPILTNQDLKKILHISEIKDNDFHAITLDITWDAKHGADGMAPRLEALCAEAETAIKNARENIIIISDRALSATRIAIPALLATAAVHHHLIRKGLRTSAGLVVETGEAREIHHLCCLAGYGAEAINPWLAFETIQDIGQHQNITPEKAITNYIEATSKGIYKVMSKMGISTYQSYCGAQIFDAVGLTQSFVNRYFTGTASRIEGVGLDEIAAETTIRHTEAFSNIAILRHNLAVGGEYAIRINGEAHAWTADSVKALQHAVRNKDDKKAAYQSYQEFAAIINTQEQSLISLRGLFNLHSAKELDRKPVPLEEVEPASEIVKRFATGAMSFGSISAEAHATLARAMNEIGGRSNTGEGGEEAKRFIPNKDGSSARSAIKQVASGRFGVTTEYLVNSDMIQIKMAQGAKPGEGGQLPGHKVDARIARVRHSTPGVGLISPPPHHDIYSIEDLAQLIFDLKNVNPRADISVKLVSEVGVGTVAAGVAKARAEHVTISGFEGGTGASPLTSIKHAGSPWEIGLAETHQTLVRNRLRTRIAVQVDGGLRTGRDVIIGAILGADEFGFATAPLIAAGCIMMRKCHLNICPVGIATQNQELRKRFNGTPEHVINYFFFVAEEVRTYLAEMGARTINEIIGKTEYLDSKKAIEHWKAKGLDFSRLFAKTDPQGEKTYHSIDQKHPLDDILDRRLIKDAAPAIKHGKPITITADINNTNRTIGAMLSGEIATKYGHKGLKPNTITVNMRGAAGQSFGAFLAHGVTFYLEGEANDYTAKGLSGGQIIIVPPPESAIIPEESIIIGNTSLYGAISGTCYFRGIAGERFAVRNSGAVAIIEGTGDHGCEYMTGGCVLVLGSTGRNFAAGMSGGIAYILDENADFSKKCNSEMVELTTITCNRDDAQRNALNTITDMPLEHDAERLYKLIAAHYAATQSEKAAAILAQWGSPQYRFIKITPHDFKRALTEHTHEQQELAGAGE